MKRKVFSVFCFTCFFIVIGSTELTKSTETDCVEVTFDAMDKMFDLGYGAEVIGCVGNFVLAECQGWNITKADYYSCIE